MGRVTGPDTTAVAADPDGTDGAEVAVVVEGGAAVPGVRARRGERDGPGGADAAAVVAVAK